jgi:methylmalonyl-CoA/ethylmalonyl-CoA epimerase
MEEPRIEGIEEVVIAVKDVDEAANYFKDLFGMEFANGWELKGERIKVRSEVIQGSQLQFIQATDSQSVVAKFIKEKGQGLNHFAFRVKNLKELVKRLKEKGVRLVPPEIVTPEAAGLTSTGKNIPNIIDAGKGGFIFIHPSSAYGVLIELIEAG